MWEIYIHLDVQLIVQPQDEYKKWLEIPYYRHKFVDSGKMGW